MTETGTDRQPDAPRERGGRLWKWTKRALVGVVGLVVFVLLAGVIYQFVATKIDAYKWYPPSGDMVDVGGSSMHLHCTGEEVNAPTVVMDIGSGGIGMDWQRVQPNGKVVFVRDGLPEQTPNATIVGVHRTLDFGGNQVVVRMGRGVYALYYHLQLGSIDVRKGEHVKTGQLIGKLGNSGNSFAPHLHFGLNTGPNAFTSNSLPFVFDRYTWAGSVDPEKSTLPNLHIEGTPRTERKSYPVTYPRALSLSDYR